MDDILLRDSKLFLIIVNEKKGTDVLNLIKKSGSPGCTKLFAKGFIDGVLNENYFNQKILLSLADKGIEGIAESVFNGSLEDTEIKGALFVIDAKNINANLTISSENNENFDRGVEMQDQMDLIVVIVSAGYSEDIMSVARTAGANGGTVVDARGTGTEEDCKFFGISIVPEKELLLIMSEKEKSSQIINAIKEHPIFLEAGAGIAFVLNAEHSFVMNNS